MSPPEGTLVRFTFGGSNTTPIWSADGTYARQRDRFLVVRPTADMVSFANVRVVLNWFTSCNGASADTLPPPCGDGTRRARVSAAGR